MLHTTLLPTYQIPSDCWKILLEKGLAIHSSILALRILWTEEPGGLQSMGVTKSQTRLNNIELNLLKVPSGDSQVAFMVKNMPANVGGVRDLASIPRSRRSPGGRRGNQLQYS